MHHVLVVDDNPIIRLLIRNILTRVGCDVICCEHGAQALDLLSHGHYDVVVMDLNMPVLDGRATIRRIRENPTISDVPVVAVSAEPLQQLAEELAELGFDALVSKPVDAAELQEQVLSCSHQSEATDDGLVETA